MPPPYRSLAEGNDERLSTHGKNEGGYRRSGEGEGETRSAKIIIQMVHRYEEKKKNEKTRKVNALSDWVGDTLKLTPCSEAQNTCVS